MITWFYGNTGAGKTAIASAYARETRSIYLDGDALREIWSLSLDKQGRLEQNERTYKLARLFESQGFNVVVATICPYKKQRDKFRNHVKFVYVEGGKSGEDFPFEKETGYVLTGDEL